MLPKTNRLRAGSDFNRITKAGVRVSSENIVIYASLGEQEQPRVGFIVNRSVIFHPYQSKACWLLEFLNNKMITQMR